MNTQNLTMLMAAAGVLGLGHVATTLALPVAPDAPGRSQARSPLQRGAVAPATPQPGIAGTSAAAVYPDEYRTIDGTGNNTANPTWGSAGTELRRLTTVDYADGIGDPAGATRLGARTVSNNMAAQPAMIPNPSAASDYLWQWGQFLDHDIDETPVTSPGEAFDISVPLGDAWFDPFSSGGIMIPLDRSAYVMSGGVREQLNNITAYIDGSVIYGSDIDRARHLRRLGGTGLLDLSPDAYLLFNEAGFPNAPDDEDTSMFLSGDVRANEQNGLTAMHTLFGREHNYQAQQIAQADPLLEEDDLYERARAIVGAEIQAITYNEFLPLLLGPDALPPYTGYQPTVDAGISNVFATAAYRVGHTMLSTQIMRLDVNGDPIAAGNMSLSNAFFNPAEITAHGIDPLLRGLCGQMCQNIDAYIIDDVRNFLFGPPGAGGFDLAALNVQRGRDHGLPSYNQVRIDFGLAPAATFADVTPDTEIQARLQATYASVDDIDPWVGMLAEPHVPGALVGETVREILIDQFTRLRDGDRFWYQGYLPPALVAQVEADTLAVIIRRNTDIGNELPDDVFIVDTTPACTGDLNDDGSVGFSDLNDLLGAWGPCPGCPQDLNDDGSIGFSDLNYLLGAWGPCP